MVDVRRQFFIDFDGTITRDDVVVKAVETFCREGWREINDRWEKREITTRECARLTFRLFDASESDIYRLLETVEIDPYFRDFVFCCEKKGYEIYILSDGYEMMISYLLRRYGLERLPVYANRLIAENGRYGIECGHFNPDCGQCGTCKRKVLQSLKKDGWQSVFVGDACSDACAAGSAEVVFAKHGLFDCCRDQGIPALPFADFSQVLAWLEQDC
ncbi:MAG: MtnX-like HAD-IB family phosphatase [Peptococcaceae bacterium]|nr:MtnX-like HAD-IB family phosphatase [Peptococcaceae bacterium]